MSEYPEITIVMHPDNCNLYWAFGQWHCPGQAVRDRMGEWRHITKEDAAKFTDSLPENGWEYVVVKGVNPLANES